MKHGSVERWYVSWQSWKRNIWVSFLDMRMSSLPRSIRIPYLCVSFFVTIFCLVREKPQRNEIRKFSRSRPRLAIRRRQLYVTMMDCHQPEKFFREENHDSNFPDTTPLRPQAIQSPTMPLGDCILEAKVSRHSLGRQSNTSSSSVHFTNLTSRIAYFLTNSRQIMTTFFLKMTRSKTSN